MGEIIERHLVGADQERAEQRARKAGRRRPGGQQDQHVADSAQADVEMQATPDDDGSAREDCGNGQGHKTDDRPGELGAQHKDLGQQHACKQDAGVGRPAEDQHGEKCAEAGVPGRDGQTIVLVDEAHPFEGEIDGKQYAGSGGLGQKRADRGKQLVDLPVPVQAGEIPSEKRYCQGVGPKWSVGGAEDIVSERVHQHARRPAAFTAMCCAVPIGRSPVTGTMIPLRSRRRYSICWRRSWASLRLANCMARAYTMHRPYGGRPSAERAKPTIVTVD